MLSSADEARLVIATTAARLRANAEQPGAEPAGLSHFRANGGRRVFRGRAARSEQQDRHEKREPRPNHRAGQPTSGTRVRRTFKPRGSRPTRSRPASVIPRMSVPLRPGLLLWPRFVCFLGSTTSTPTPHERGRSASTGATKSVLRVRGANRPRKSQLETTSANDNALALAA
jgi:hypothetical protein